VYGILGKTFPQKFSASPSPLRPAELFSADLPASSEPVAAASVVSRAYNFPQISLPPPSPLRPAKLFSADFLRPNLTPSPSPLRPHGLKFLDRLERFQNFFPPFFFFFYQIEI
jgi:hypothetical protein